MRLRQQSRTGATLVECAFVYPAVFILTLGLLIGTIGIFRFQEMATLSREAARYAAVHGRQYAKDTGNPAATDADIFNNAVVPMKSNLDLDKLGYTITWNTNNNPYHTKIVNGDI